MPQAPPTYAVPDRPQPPTYTPDVPHLQKTTALFISWVQPNDYGDPIMKQELQLDDEIITFDENQTTAYQKRPLMANTRVSVRYRAHNNQGPSDWSSEAFMITDPDVPLDLHPPVCVDLRSVNQDLPATTSLAVSLKEANPQGEPIDERRIGIFTEVGRKWVCNVTLNSTGEASTEVVTRGTCSGLLASSRYSFQVQSRNALGWGEWSNMSAPSLECRTTASAFAQATNHVDKTVQIVMLAMVGLGVMAAIAAYLFLKMYLQKRNFNAAIFGGFRKKDTDPTKKVEGFMTSEYTPGVDDAVDVEVNPVMLYQIETDKGKKQKEKKKGGGTGKSGGLKRLGLNISPELPKKELGKVKSLAQLEAHLAGQGVDLTERVAARGGNVEAGKKRTTIVAASEAGGSEAMRSKKQSLLSSGRMHSRAAMQSMRSMKAVAIGGGVMRWTISRRR